MKRVRKPAPSRLSRDAQALIKIATALHAASSSLEREFWMRQLSDIAGKSMDAGKDNNLDAALEHTYHHAPAVHDILVVCCEAAAESAAYDIADEAAQHGLLMAIPIIAWSKYPIPVGLIPYDEAMKIVALLEKHILSAQAHVMLDSTLVAMDQLPVGFVGIRKLATDLTTAAAGGPIKKMKWQKFKPEAEYMADCRFLLAGITAPLRQALFRWQDSNVTRDECFAAWAKDARPLLARHLPGCEFSCLLPDAFFASFRNAEQAMRPATVRASVSFLETSLPTTPPKLRAVIAGVGTEQADEYRIAFTERGRDEVLTGVVWPLTELEDAEANPAPSNAIESLLREIKVGEVTMLDGLFAPEYCDDCGAPLFPNADGEAVHPYMPEGTEHPAAHYH